MDTMCKKISTLAFLIVAMPLVAQVEKPPQNSTNRLISTPPRALGQLQTTQGADATLISVQNAPPSKELTGSGFTVPWASNVSADDGSSDPSGGGAVGGVPGPMCDLPSPATKTRTTQAAKRSCPSGQLGSISGVNSFLDTASCSGTEVVWTSQDQGYKQTSSDCHYERSCYGAAPATKYSESPHNRVSCPSGQTGSATGYNTFVDSAICRDGTWGYTRKAVWHVDSTCH